MTCRIATRRLRRDAGAAGHNACERHTGERRDAGAGTAPPCEHRGQAATLTGGGQSRCGHSRDFRP